jgi:hypothetical protein
MKKRIALLLSVVMAISMLIASAFPASAEGISPRLTNADTATVAFTITSSGAAHFSVDYTGIAGEFTEAKVTVKIEKQFLWFFWTEVDAWSATCYERAGFFTHTFYLNESGTYRANYRLEFYGTSGDVDVIENTQEDSY